MESLADIKTAIMADSDNRFYTKRGIKPLCQFDNGAKIVIIGQAPGLTAQKRGRLFADPSGLQLRSWLGLDEQTFYDSQQIAILPMDFYYPGKGQAGDLPPRMSFAKKWHPQILAHLTQVELTLLIGVYAQNYYLGHLKKRTLTEIVRQYKDYLPQYLPLVHPSPRNNGWQAKNPWFQLEIVPFLQEKVAQILEE